MILPQYTLVIPPTAFPICLEGAPSSYLQRLRKVYPMSYTLVQISSFVFAEYSTFHFILLSILDLSENSRFGLLIPLRQPRTLNPEPLLVSLVSIFICFNTIIARLVSHVS